MNRIEFLEMGLTAIINNPLSLCGMCVCVCVCGRGGGESDEAG